MQGWKIWDEFFIEKKLDGERQLVHKRGSKYKIFSRKQVDHTGVYGAALAKHLDAAIGAATIVAMSNTARARALCVPNCWPRCTSVRATTASFQDTLLMTYSIRVEA